MNSSKIISNRENTFSEHPRSEEKLESSFTL